MHRLQNLWVVTFTSSLFHFSLLIKLCAGLLFFYTFLSSLCIILRFLPKRPIEKNPDKYILISSITNWTPMLGTPFSHLLFPLFSTPGCRVAVFQVTQLSSNLSIPTSSLSPTFSVNECRQVISWQPLFIIIPWGFSGNKTTTCVLLLKKMSSCLEQCIGNELAAKCCHREGCWCAGLRKLHTIPSPWKPESSPLETLVPKI